MNERKLAGMAIALVLALGGAFACGDDGGTDEDTGTDTSTDVPTDDAAVDTSDVPADETLTCFYPEIECDGACVNTDFDPDHCGNCETACTSPQVCDDGGCSDTCTDPLVDCDRSCVDILSDEDNCGECGEECGEGLTCGYTVCTSETCEPGEVYCFGHCTSLSSDTYNCGECGNECNIDTEQCQEGVCMPAA